MIAITALQRRLSLLEPRFHPSDDLSIERALAMLSDADLEVMQEASELNDAGYTAEDISFMMAERWPRYQESAARFQEAYLQAVDVLKGERRPWALSRPAAPGQQECFTSQ
jgi:hypothetical protein